MSTLKYEAICNELDTLSIAYLDKISEYHEQWKDTSEHFQQGYLNLAHAKYTMGARTISHYSYDERMKATLQVEIDADNNVYPKVVPLSQPEESTEKKEEKEEEGLRKRNVHEPEKKKNSEWVAVDETKKAINEEQHDIELDEKKNKKKIRKARDPLHWFGLFVSPSLRTSQDHFKLATEQLIRQVNKVRELQEMEKKYQELQEEKIAIGLQKMALEQQQSDEKITA